MVPMADGEVSSEATEHNTKLQASAVIPRGQERIRRTDQCLLLGRKVIIPGDRLRLAGQKYA